MPKIELDIPKRWKKLDKSRHPGILSCKKILLMDVTQIFYVIELDMDQRSHASCVQPWSIYMLRIAKAIHCDHKIPTYFLRIFKLKLYTDLRNNLLPLKGLSMYGFLTSDAFSYTACALSCSAMQSKLQLINQGCEPLGPFVLKDFHTGPCTLFL